MSAVIQLNDRDEEAQHVLRLLQSHSYHEVSAITGWSRGKIWRAATTAGARKHERRIRDRKAKREQQLATLAEIANETVTADVLDFLDGIPDECANLLISSPPYNVGKSYAAHDDRMRHLYYIGWLMQVISECARILKPGGTIALEVGVTRRDDGTRVPLQKIFHDILEDAGLTWQNTVSWVAPHGLTPKHRLADRHEDILIFTKGEKPAVFNPAPARTPQKNPAKCAFKGPNKGELSGHPLGSFPSDVWTDIDHVRANTPERTGHPAQFSLALARRLTLLYSMPGDLVVDVFSGTGTTQAAAIETGRNFVGADLSYEDIRAARLARVSPDTVSVLPGVTAESAAIWQAHARRVDSPTLFD